VRAIELLGLTSFASAEECLLGLLRQDEPQEVQSAALKTLGRFKEPAVAEALVGAWPTLTPRLREQTVPVLLARPERVVRLLAALDEGVFRKSDLTSVQIDRLMNHRYAPIQKEAVRLLTSPRPFSSEELFATYEPSLQLSGDPAKGRVIFQERCASCHRLGNEGHNLGPDLASVRNTGKEKMLVSILDPNRELLPQYAAFEVETKDDESFMGLVADENAGAVTLLQAYGVETVIMRDQILSLRGLGKSIMPEGLEAQMTAQAMADLLEFIGTANP
jgi:putative heme-binding domain-containing protein